MQTWKARPWSYVRDVKDDGNPDISLSGDNIKELRKAIIISINLGEIGS